jgi:hypothetical protein
VTTIAELSIDAEFGPLEEAAAHHGWLLKRVSVPVFMLDIKARDGTWFSLHADCTGYDATPPAWHWRDIETNLLDQPGSMPAGGGYFHGNGVICAPWNRLAYQTIDPRGPHGDWTIGDWRTNPRTGACTTLAAMALRIGFELTKESFSGQRMAA